MKYSSKLPSSRNDILKVYASVKRDEIALSDAIGRLVNYCNKNSIAEVMIPTNNGIIDKLCLY